MKVLAVCDGIASGYDALKRLGYHEVEYHAIEIRAYKRLIADDNHKGIIRPSHDVVEYLENGVFGFYDAFLCGFSCTSLTSQGGRKDWDGDSKIFFTCADILDELRKINPNIKFFFENVASMRVTARDLITQRLGVQPFLGHAGYISLQDRDRYYWFNWEKPDIQDISASINPRTVLDDDGIALFTTSKSNRNKIGEAPIVEGRIKPNKAGTLITGKGCRGQSTATFVITKKLTVRPLTIPECSRLQGIGHYFWPCTEAQTYEAIGEGWQVNMIMEIFKKTNWRQQ